MAKQYNASHLPILGLKSYSKNNPKIKRVLRNLSDYSHILLTSRNSVKIFMTRSQKHHGFTRSMLQQKIYILIGPTTVQTLKKFGNFRYLQAQTATAEGLIDLMKQNLQCFNNVLYLHSALSRPVIQDYLNTAAIQHTSVPHYTVYPRKIRLPLHQIKEIIFASPSGVEFFDRNTNHRWPSNINYRTIGPITEQKLKLKLNERWNPLFEEKERK